MKIGNLPALAIACLLASSCAAAGDAPTLGRGDHWYRSESFCIALHPDETIERQDGGGDFILYLYRRGAEEIVIYQGNYPSPGGVLLRTGLPFPALLSVHGPRALARRLLVGARASACD